MPTGWLPTEIEPTPTAKELGPTAVAFVLAAVELKPSAVAFTPPVAKALAPTAVEPAVSACGPGMALPWRPPPPTAVALSAASAVAFGPHAKELSVETSFAVFEVARALGGIAPAFNTQLNALADETLTASAIALMPAINATRAALSADLEVLIILHPTNKNVVL